MIFTRASGPIFAEDNAWAARGDTHHDCKDF
jgi:hypothetical protein